MGFGPFIAGHFDPVMTPVRRAKPFAGPAGGLANWACQLARDECRDVSMSKSALLKHQPNDWFQGLSLPRRGRLPLAGFRIEPRSGSMGP
jgi:hypothetical protein